MAIDWTTMQKKYKGLWVALADNEETVLGVGKTAREAFEQARIESDEIPFLTRVPEKIAPFVGFHEV